MVILVCFLFLPLHNPRSQNLSQVTEQNTETPGHWDEAGMKKKGDR